MQAPPDAPGPSVWAPVSPGLFTQLTSVTGAFLTGFVVCGLWETRARALGSPTLAEGPGCPRKHRGPCGRPHSLLASLEWLRDPRTSCWQSPQGLSLRQALWVGCRPEARGRRPGRWPFLALGRVGAPMCCGFGNRSWAYLECGVRHHAGVPRCVYRGDQRHQPEEDSVSSAQSTGTPSTGVFYDSWPPPGCPHQFRPAHTPCRLRAPQHCPHCRGLSRGVGPQLPASISPLLLQIGGFSHPLPRFDHLPAWLSELGESSPGLASLS